MKVVIYLQIYLYIPISLAKIILFLKVQLSDSFEMRVLPSFSIIMLQFSWME